VQMVPTGRLYPSTSASSVSRREMKGTGLCIRIPSLITWVRYSSLVRSLLEKTKVIVTSHKSQQFIYIFTSFVELWGHQSTSVSRREMKGNGVVHAHPFFDHLRQVFQFCQVAPAWKFILWIRNLIKYAANETKQRIPHIGTLELLFFFFCNRPRQGFGGSTPTVVGLDVMHKQSLRNGWYPKCLHTTKKTTFLRQVLVKNLPLLLYHL
jgi:hypothetical protein